MLYILSATTIIIGLLAGYNLINNIKDMVKGYSDTFVLGELKVTLVLVVFFLISLILAGLYL